MLDRAKLPLVLILALSCIALLGYSQVWADPTPKATTIIYDGTIKAEFAPNGDLIGVSFLKDGCTPTTSDTCWDDSVAGKPAVICICNGAECDDNLTANLDNPDVALDCHEVTKSGPKFSGCPLHGSNGFLMGGSFFLQPPPPLP